MQNMHVICDFRAGTFLIHNGNGRPVFTPTSYRATQYESRIKARVKADALNAAHPEMDCDVITAAAAWALERIQMRDNLLRTAAIPLCGSGGSAGLESGGFKATIPNVIVGSPRRRTADVGNRRFTDAAPLRTGRACTDVQRRDCYLEVIDRDGA